ncbi:MAG: hypothetical protein ACR2QM_02660 [Longimicrobiales bacterium]
MRVGSIPGLGLGRTLLAQALGWGARTVNGAGLAGILFGAGETIVGHMRDYVLAVPNGFKALGHYLHGGRHIDQFARTVEYVNNDAPSVDELQHVLAGSRSWLNRFDLATGSIQEGLQELGDAEIVLGTSDIRWGLTNMPPRAELDTVVTQARAILEPAMGYLSEVELDPIVQAAARASDNLAGDEILGTLLTAVVLCTALWILSSYVITMWVRRGLPSFLGRAWMRAGTRSYSGWYEQNHKGVLRALGLGHAGGAPPDPTDQSR